MAHFIPICYHFRVQRQPTLRRHLFYPIVLSMLAAFTARPAAGGMVPTESWNSDYLTRASFPDGTKTLTLIVNLPQHTTDNMHYSDYDKKSLTFYKDEHQTQKVVCTFVHDQKVLSSMDCGLTPLWKAEGYRYWFRFLVKRINANNVELYTDPSLKKTLWFYLDSASGVETKIEDFSKQFIC